MYWCVILVSLCFTTAVHSSANSLRDPYICGSPTCSLSEKFKYLQDVNYHYKYKTNVETYFAGSSNNRSTLDIQADVKIQFITPCEGLLALSDVTLTDQDQNYPAERADRFFHAVSQYDLRFAFHDGIVSEICPEQLEEEWVLNFKRAILSLFQNSMKRFDIDFKGVEQDIHGSCSVQYTVRGQKTTSLVLVKTRDLAQCTDRFQYMSILQTVRYDFQSKFQTWPVLKSESKCVVTVDHHIYKAVQCRERHLFEPFSGRNSGAMTTVIQDLVLIREDNKTNNEVVQSQPKAWSEITKRSNLLHHHTTYGNTGSIAELKSARDVLKLLCQIRESGNENNATVEEKLDSGSTVGLWGRLVRAARGLHHAALAQLLARAPAICDTATKHLMDALPYIASAGSVELIKDMITNNSVDSDTRHEWLMSMAMIPRPNIAMLGSMLELLGGQPRDKVVSFTVSSMLHSYCKHSGKSLRECCEEEVPRRILEVFQGIVDEIVVKDLANLSRDEREKLVIAMKAMGNIGGFSRRAADALTLVVGDAAAPVPVRLAAVDAFRRTPCGETREYFLETYRAVSVAVEVRLAAYLQVMRCPDLPTVRKLVHQLRHEPVNQVLSPVSEEENTEDSLSPISSFLNSNSDSVDRDNVAADNDGNSSDSSSVSIYPDLIIEREPNPHDEPEEYYQELKVRMRKAYKRMFFGICDEQSSKGDTPNNEIADKTGDVDTTERLCSYEPPTNEQIQDKPDDNVINSSSIQRDANSRPILSKLGRPDCSISHDTHESEERFETNDDRAPVENRTERNFVHLRAFQSSESSNTSEEAYARRGQSHAKTFVWSHLHNVAQSSLPSRVEIQSLLSGNPPPRLDDRPDFRMYSRNYERSVFFDQYNAGGNYEANVVFSPDSYIPRSVSLNLTVDMFGESINLLELKGRVEGFERYFEQLFGDGGPLSKTKLNDVISGVRFLRSLNNADEVRRKIDQLGFESEALKHQLPVAELVVKVFGNEISFWNAEGHDEIAQALARLNPKLRILEILSGKEISYNKASLFVDTTFSVATGCGLPLAMNLMGTSYVNTNMSGAFTREANSPTLLFEGKIRPSVAVNIAATMTVSAGGLSASGVRLTARLYTATALGARLRADGLTALRLHLSLPTDKQEIFAAKSELVVLHGDTELQQQGLNKNRIEQNTCSWSAFDRAIGIKVCAAYQFPNMTNLPHAPYFLLSGPAKYVVSLEKADPSAKTYVLDYKWVKNATADVISFAFDTPNSLEKRKFDAVLSVSNASSTALVSFQSSRTSMHARALYRNLDGDKSVEASIEVDGRKQFEAVVAMRRQPIPHGHVWLPRAYLVVDDARVAELAGSIKAKSKGGVVQWDITVDFQTKQLASRLIGYYTINGPTHGTKLQLDYEFHRNPKQAIKLEGVYSERVMGYRHDLFGDVSMEFTAYPAYNFYAVLRYVRVQGHVDVGFNVSASRALVGTPALAFGYSRVDKLSGLTLDTHLLLTKPWPVKVIYHFEEIGPKYTVSALLNFSPRSRDIAVSGYLYAPPGSQLYADAQLNATLPSLHPCTLRAKLHEKRPNHYQVNLAGVWFTGVDFNVDALYEDTSRTNLASHHLKLLVSGAQFPDVAVDARFTQDNRQITFVGSGQYNEHEYRALLRHVLHSAKNFSTYVELDAGRETYSINLAADLNNNTNINVDIHFDEQRDIQITFSRWWGEQARRVRAAVHWDANRDPEQKVALDAQLERRAAWHHAGRAALYYPGRMISTDFEFLLRDWFCEWHLMMSWSNAANILWRVKMYSEARQETVYALLSTMTTPFAGLEDTSFNVMWRYHDNLQALNGSMSWQRERLSVGLLADYSLRSDEFYGRLTAEVNSTRPALPSAAAAATHRVLWGRSADTLLSFQYNNEGLLMINSSWLLEPGEKEHNVTGRVTLLSPFKGYRRGALSTRFVLGHKRDISGVTHFDLEDKILDIYVDGHLRRITNCMVRVNATSPALPRPLVAARFGLVEADRHLVAMVVTPNSTTGIEVLLKLKSVQDFNVYGHIALPIQYLNRAKITAKRAFEEVDLRVGWGDMDLGFTGIWHWRSLSNFVYLYKLYTPLEGFEENGLVLKNVYGNGLDTEVSMQLSKHKFGVAIQLEDKGKGLLVVVSERLQRPRALELIGDFDTTASVVLDTLYYPTVTFRAHLMKYEDSTGVNIVEANATLHLPDMPPVVLADTFVMEDLLTVRNTLSLVTPFQAMQEVKSVWTMQVIYPEFVNATFVALLYNGTYWHEISSKLFYELSTGEDDAYNAHAASLAVRTPLPVLPALEAAVTVRIEDKLWKMTAGIQMPSFNITAIGRLELDDPFVETSGSLNLTSPHLEDYHIRMEFKKDVSSDQEYTMGGGVHVTQGGHVNYMYAEGAMGPALWRVSSRFELWPAVPATRLALRYEWRPPGAALSAELAAPGRDYSLLASATDRSLLLDVATPHRGYRSVRADCTAEPLDATNYTVRGQLATDHRQYDVTGQLHRAADVQVSLELVPRGGGESIVVRGRYSAAQAQRAVQASASGALRAELQASVQCAGNGDAGDAGYPYCDIDVEVSAPQYRARPARLAYRLQRRGGERRALRLRTDAPLPALRNLTADADFQFGPKTGYLLCNYGLSNLTGDGNLTWSFFEGDMFIRALGHQLIEQAQRSVDLDIYFGNTTQDGLGKTNAGFRMDLDRIWLIGANSSFGYNLRQLHLVINAILPRPSVDVHTLRLDVHTDKQLYRVLNAEYTTDVTKIVTGLKGRMLLSNDSFIGNASALWTSNGQYKAIDNRLLYRWHTNVSYHLDYGLVSPLYAGEDTFNVNGSYTKDAAENYHIVNGVMHRPGGRRLGELALRYGGVRHTRGHFNCSTPFGRLPWLRAVFHISNSEEQSDNKVDLYWPLKYASLNTTHRYTKRADGFTQIGDVSLLIPLSASHLVTTNYYYVQGDKTSNGNATLDLDHVRFVKGSFDQIVGSSERGLDLSTSDIRVENDYAPVGVKYIHEYDDTGDVDAKQATVFHLTNATKFNVTGKLDVATRATGKDVRLIAVHGNRTLTIDNRYEAAGNELEQGSKITWSEDVWFHYHIRVTNMSTEDTERQRAAVEVRYPRRSYGAAAQYELRDALLAARLRLRWDTRGENKTAELRARWDGPPHAGGARHRLALALHHPSFRKNVTLDGEYLSTPSVMSNVSLELQYSDDDSEYLKLRSLVVDNSDGPIRDYKFGLTCTHPSTNLDLEIASEVRIHHRWYYFNDYYRYKKTLFTEKLKHNKLVVDLNNNTIQVESTNDTSFYKLNGSWSVPYGRWGARATVLRPTGNDSASAALSLRDRRLVAHYNSTDDVSYHLLGVIPDARSARLDAWRDYGDVTTVDLASYVRLNHSRLLTSSVVWRPQVFGEIKARAVYTLKRLYDQINGTLTVIKDAPMEANRTLKNIWLDAEPQLRDFISDLNDLHVIKDDLDEFKVFINESYESNDFYVKDIVEFTYYVLDEMAIRNHLESLPGIVNDMWGMMGNTSQSIKQSLTFVADKVKMAYSDFLVSVDRFLEADFMQIVSNKLESMILQYDNFVRDLHMKLLEYWEATWVNATNRLYQYWHDILKSIEPLFFKIVHYTESVVFTLGKGVLDFFYDRTQELTDSPYFNYVATFGHEMDKIYKDLTHNDLITNVKKYSRKVWSAVWTKVERYLPFKDEVAQLRAEFAAAWDAFRRSAQVVYVTDKCQEAYIRLKWWYDYFLIGEALDRVGEILYAKLTDMAKTALQYEELHRTPKTNFIFDPRKGEILLEQKLPMSWHAFNRTPELAEVAEYRAARQLLDDWLAGDRSLWSLYYEVRPYMDVDNVLPPFAGLAMMTGQGTLVTFDKRVLTLSRPGTFLLARDYRCDNFTVLMASSGGRRGAYDLVVLTRTQLIRIDLYREQVSLGGDAPLTLPALVDGWLVARQADSVTVGGPGGLRIDCSLLFRTCKIEVAGWYYATLGGLLGTYNNEQFDELRLPNNSLARDDAALARSWNIEPEALLAAPLAAPLAEHDHEPENDTQCEKFFLNKVSPLHPCFSVIEASPFHSWCARGVSACSLASAYMQLCEHQHVPTRMPDHCLQCTTPSGEVVEEGAFHELRAAPRSTDVVFVMEAQRCNRGVRKARHADLLVEALDSKLQGAGLSDNRYAIVGFGGSGVYREPRALYVNNRVFTDAVGVAHHFDNFYVESEDASPRARNRSSGGGGDDRPPVDMLRALRFATRLVVRAGVPRTLVLLPCARTRSRCDPATSTLDYSTIYHNLMESSVTLHILMDDDFMLSKRRAAKYLFGVDSNLAYTNKDYERLVGDAGLRKQVKLPKEKLGLCTSLAMETNGTIFAGRKLQGERAAARRFATVFGARAAAAAGAARGAAACARAARCECRDARLHCAPCADTQRMMELSFWNSEDIDELMDASLEAPALP